MITESKKSKMAFKSENSDRQLNDCHVSVTQILVRDMQVPSSVQLNLNLFTFHKS
jgi:hypothetical protein